jgi:hypothetical protein
LSKLNKASLAVESISSDLTPSPSHSLEERRGSYVILVLLFVVTLPLINPWVRGDGVGYYAYVRSMLVEHKLDFADDWRNANESFSMGRVRQDGTIDPGQYTRTGYLDNHFSVGPAMLWAPFLAPVHAVMLLLKMLGFNVQANGYSRPYLVMMSLATALYGFVGLLISFRLACRFVEERWAFLATLGIWFGSSLPVYMYFNPSWSHAHSVFAVAVFLWYWQRTRQARTPLQWIILGLISGVVLDVYYANIAVLLVPFVESLQGYWRSLREPTRDWKGAVSLLGNNLLYCLATLIAFLPTLITRHIIYGSPVSFGYGDLDVTLWASPRLASVLFSSDHGMLVWTPIIIPALVGLCLLQQRDCALAVYLGTAFLALFYIISIDSCWDGISSFGNRFFVSLTPMFILGLAVFWSELAKWVQAGKLEVAAVRSVTALIILWNLAFIFQWGTHMVPARGPISWEKMIRNQFIAVPQRASTEIAAYLGNRRALMRQIEQEDVHQLKKQQSGASSQ